MGLTQKVHVDNPTWNEHVQEWIQIKHQPLIGAELKWSNNSDGSKHSGSFTIRSISFGKERIQIHGSSLSLWQTENHVSTSSRLQVNRRYRVEHPSHSFLVSVLYPMLPKEVIVMLGHYASPSVFSIDQWTHFDHWLDPHACDFIVNGRPDGYVLPKRSLQVAGLIVPYTTDLLYYTGPAVWP